MLTPEESLAIYHAGPEAVAQALCDLSQQVALLQEQIATKDKQIKVLEDQIAKNSRNSSKRPITLASFRTSRDGLFMISGNPISNTAVTMACVTPTTYAN